MTTIGTFVKQHPARTYFGLTFVISWGGVFIVVGPGGFPGTSEQFKTLLPFAVLAMLAGPSVASPLLFGIAGALVVGFFEELGWTGYAVPS